MLNPSQLARLLQEFLAEARSGVALEDDQVIFELDSAEYSISSERGRCLLHLWSEQRNLVREVLDATAKASVLELTVRSFAKARAHKLQLCRDRDRRTASVKKSVRTQYARLLERVLRHEAPDWALDKNQLSTSMDLEHSFSPVYARGLLRKGRSAFAVLGVNQQETQASVDAALTFGLLWLDACREREAGRGVVEGLRIFVPHGRASTLQIRLAHLNRAAAKFHIVELDERDESFTEIDAADLGNINTRLVRLADAAQVRERFAPAIKKILTLAPQAEIALLSPMELAFRLHGLEFARARSVNLPGSFRMESEIVFGVGGFQARLDDALEPAFAEFVKTVVEARELGGDRRDPLWRMYPERWLESLVIKNVGAIDSRLGLDPPHVYSQVPAFSASDRAMIDVLTSTRDARLAVLELKADEDINLPLQGLDYWARVLWHHQRGEFQQYGYFASVELSPRPPLLFLVAPSLRVHPAVDVVLRYVSPQIEWTLVGVDERWREGIKVIFRKTSDRRAAATS
jgi:hypothetical protein